MPLEHSPGTPNKDRRSVSNRIRIRGTTLSPLKRRSSTRGSGWTQCEGEPSPLPVKDKLHKIPRSGALPVRQEQSSSEGGCGPVLPDGHIGSYTERGARTRSRVRQKIRKPRTGRRSERVLGHYPLPEDGGCRPRSLRNTLARLLPSPTRRGPRLSYKDTCHDGPVSQCRQAVNGPTEITHRQRQPAKATPPCKSNGY